MLNKIKLKQVLEKEKIIPKKKLGQNFIFDFNVLNKIVKNILPIKDHTVIEIGPGPGGLTRSILEQSPKEIILIEKDKSFKNILTLLLKEFPKIKSTLLIADFMEVDVINFIKPDTKILSNLPYYVSTQILLKILPLDKNIKEVIFTFQKEVAERIISKPNNKNYSRLSVIAQSVCNITLAQKLPAKIFYPEPKIDSTVLKFVKKKNIIIKDFTKLKTVTKKAFNKRRKKIKNSLKEIKNISIYLQQLNINEQSRPENISVDAYCNLANTIKEI